VSGEARVILRAWPTAHHQHDDATKSLGITVCIEISPVKTHWFARFPFYFSIQRIEKACFVQEATDFNMR
jgi:hypothetical protein